MLKYAPFYAVKGLTTVDSGGKPIGKQQSGPAVAMIQAALLELGAKMPKTSAQHGAPDGIFGSETHKAVMDFQAKHKLKVDGVVGKHTLSVLDRLMLAHSATKPAPAPSPPAQIPSPRHPDYQLGHADPPLGTDSGSGAWNSKETSAIYFALKLQIVNSLPHAYLLVGRDAAKHMAHYFANTGRQYTIDLEGMLAQVPSAQANLEVEAMQAQEFSETLPPGNHKITSRSAEGGYNTKDENSNWYFATGGYVSWGKGDLVVQSSASGRVYDLQFEYKFFDRYNWDKGKQVTLFGKTITDEFMGEFHRQGLAREFDCVGSVKRRLTWKHGQAIAQAQLRGTGGRA